jgi:Mlc titration factor MtfA (ptsG expression regulator)
MLRDYIQQKQRQLLEQQTDFYTSTGIHVYFKDPVENEEINVETVVNDIESIIPAHLLSEVEMIIIGWFDEFEERSINAFYDGGTLYVSNVQNDFMDMYDDIIHEISHSLEEPHGYFIYGDKKIENEFLRKRKFLHDILWQKGFKAPMTVFMELEYNKDFDMFLYEKIGYDKLTTLVEGIFVTPYAATSLREYYATGFTEFYVNPDTHGFLQKVSPELYKKLISLQEPEELDN